MPAVEGAECNYCVLQEIKVWQPDVEVRPVVLEGERWRGVFAPGDPEPLAVFPVLTAHCVC